MTILGIRPPTMAIAGTDAHLLVFPYPAQGHMLPLFYLSCHLAARGLAVTVLVTPKNLSLLSPLLSDHPSIQTLILPLPPHPSLPVGIENVKDLPRNAFRALMQALAGLYDPLLQWFRDHPSPPTAILSDIFLGWTNKFAADIGIRRFVFSPSGAFSLSVIYSLWGRLPKLENPGDVNAPISFPEVLDSPVFPWRQLSTVYQSYVEGDPVSEFIKDGFYGNMASWGLVINSLSELERAYLEGLKNQLGHDRVWAVGPIVPPAGGTADRGETGLSQATDIFSWLDTCQDRTVLYVCFGSQQVLRNEQMEKLALGLEKSGAKFIWSVKEPTAGHVAGEYGQIPHGFRDRGAGRWLVVKGWAPQVGVLSHRAVGGFLTHCGWNSVMESVVAGVPMLTWPMGADQFTKASLVVDHLGVGVRVCEGAETVPDSDELARLVANSMSEDGRVERVKKLMKYKRAAADAVNKGGSSYVSLDDFASHLCRGGGD